MKMNLEVRPEELCKVLKDVRELIKDNILPRLTDLEEQVRLLRRVTWPVCQTAKEKVLYSDQDEFLKTLDRDEILWLLREKLKLLS